MSCITHRFAKQGLLSSRSLDITSAFGNVILPYDYSAVLSRNTISSVITVTREWRSNFLKIKIPIFLRCKRISTCFFVWLVHSTIPLQYEN